MDIDGPVGLPSPPVIKYAHIHINFSRHYFYLTNQPHQHHLIFYSTLSEYSADEARLAALFYTLDSHKDGFVTVEELEHYFLNKGEVVDREEIEVGVCMSVWLPVCMAVCIVRVYVCMFICKCSFPLMIQTLIFPNINFMRFPRQ